MSKVAVIQSNYLPWKGYFDIIHEVDHFIFYDDVQFTKNDWRNRNRIKAREGSAWLTVPVGGNERRLISEVALPDPRWQVKHWKTLQQYYGRARHFERYRQFLEEAYLVQRWDNLSALNQHLIRSIALDFLGIDTRFSNSDQYSLQGQKADRLLDLLLQVKASVYVSGPAAQNYLEPSALADAGIRLVYHSYVGYPEYPQFFPPFDHYVSVLDLLFHTGEDAPHYIWGWRNESSSARMGASF